MSKIYVPAPTKPAIWRFDSVGDAFAAATIVILGAFAVGWGTLL